MLAWLLGRSPREQNSVPVQALGRRGLAVSEQQDYTVRAPKLGNDEGGALTDGLRPHAGSAHLGHRGAQVLGGWAAAAPAPAILLTGSGQRLTACSQIPQRIDRVLNKPPRLRELREALAELARRG